MSCVRKYYQKYIFHKFHPHNICLYKSIINGLSHPSILSYVNFISQLIPSILGTYYVLRFKPYSLKKMPFVFYMKCNANVYRHF